MLGGRDIQHSTFNIQHSRAPLAGLAIGLAGFGFFLWCFYIRYYKWRDCFNEEGRCYDPDGSLQVYTVAGMCWGWISVVFLLIAVASAIVLRRRRR